MKLSLSLSKSDHDSRREISELNNNNFPCAAEIHFLNIVFGGEKIGMNITFSILSSTRRIEHFVFDTGP
jgi:hypothetical protein